MHKNAIDLTGRKFGALLVVAEQGRSNDRKVLWRCQCDCGNAKTFRSHHLLSGASQSCGCIRQERAVVALTTHGMSHTREYYTWQGMIRRCTESSNKRYSRYGGRGIRVCERWMNFSHFISDMGKKPEGLSLDRIDNDGNYEPNNCRWATAKEQANNRSTSRPHLKDKAHDMMGTILMGYDE